MASSSANFDEINSQLQSSALKATRNSMLLPSDVNFHRTMDPEFSDDLDVVSSRVLSLTNKLLTLVGTADPSGKGKGKLEHQDDVLDNFHSIVVDAMDQMMEKTDMGLDEFLGRNKNPAIAINTSVKKAPTKPKVKSALDPVIQHASNLPKPQLNFKRKVENNDVPWRPLLSHKFNAQVPLGFNYHKSESDLETDSLIKLHPYRYEITHIDYPSRMFESFTPIPPTPFESTPFKWVKTIFDLNDMLDELRKATEIAVDLEHHSYRSYAGFLCLMQVSTRQQDWIVDLLRLREEMQILNEVFTDPKITKVFHGAESDIVWLQSDLEIYVVNLFDTFHASKVLGFPRHGLANLLEMYCDFTPDKRYQLADWRIRPLPEEMLDYARSDTHFLLYIYDNLRNALLDRAVTSMDTIDSDGVASASNSYPPVQRLVREVLAKSEETALRVYENEYYDAEAGTGRTGWDTMAKKWNKINLYASSMSTGIPGMQKDIYRSIHSWRDRVAREEDESTRYVLANHYLFQLAEQPPGDMAAMLRMFHFVPSVLKRRAKELLAVIREALKKHLSSIEETVSQGKAPSNLLQNAVPEEHHSLAKSGSESAGSLWKLGQDEAPKSSLFGDIKPAPIKQSESGNNSSSISAPHSSLFGKTVSLASSQTNLNHAFSPTSRFAEVVERIHRTLVIAPTAAKATASESHAKINSISAEAEEDGILAVDSQMEMPFIPASQRGVNADTASHVDDTIVVVGQARQKKRKRAKDSSNFGEGNSQPSEKDKEEVETAPFDFASAPSILDTAPSAEQSAIPRKKAKKVKGRGAGPNSNFPAPPKAYSEVKSGNKSYTFK